MFKEMDHTAFFDSNKLRWVADLCDSYGLRVGEDTEVLLYNYGLHPHITYVVNLTIHSHRAQPAAIRKIKRDFTLEVPSYALDGTFEEPPLMGDLSISSPRPGVRAVITVIVNGAYICKQVGTQEREPSEFDLLEAAKRDAMTDEQVLAKHREEIEKMRTPKTVPSYRCEPNR